MNSIAGSNIDDVRAEIMRLENEPVFDQRAWAAVLAQLTDSPNRRHDAVRRMMTARQNATAILEQPHWVGGLDISNGQDRTVIQIVSMETVEAADVEMEPL